MCLYKCRFRINHAVVYPGSSGAVVTPAGDLGLRVKWRNLPVALSCSHASAGTPHHLELDAAGIS
jgi:hypothetical protein